MPSSTSLLSAAALATFALLLGGCRDEPQPVTPGGAMAPADPALATLYANTCKTCHANPASGAPLAGDAAAWSLASHWLDQPLPGHQPVALRQALKLLELECAPVQEKASLLQAVERAIARDLQEGCRIDKVASDLNMSSRTLRRHLVEHGITFDALQEQVRRARATSLLGNPRMPVERVAEVLGYSDVRGFRRAFKRWTGLSPSAWREKAPVC